MRYAICLVVLLAGCESLIDPGKKEREAREQAARAEAYRRHVNAQCRAYGFKEETPEYRQCLMQVDMAYRQQDEAQRQMLMQQFIHQRGIFR